MEPLISVRTSEICSQPSLELHLLGGVRRHFVDEYCLALFVGSF